MGVLNFRNKTGFTIIEVVLVLAIAGLIFLMVFLGLPALQRSQRNEQRKRDMLMIADAIHRYKTNNRGRIPDDFDAIRPYLPEVFQDPDGSNYDVSMDRGVYINRDSNGHSTFGFNYKTFRGDTQVRVHIGSKCLPESGRIDQSNVNGNSNMAIAFKLEDGSGGEGNNGIFYCVDA